MYSPLEDALTIADKTFTSRLLIGSSQYPNNQVMLDAVAASGAQIVTVAIRRVDLAGGGESVLDLLEGDYHILPNTAGCFTAKDALLTAELAREALETNWIKLEVIGDRETLYPDVEHLLTAAADMVKSGFTVMAYCTDDPITCRKLADLGCAAVMPLGSPIGSGMGILNPYNIEIIRAENDCPIIIDAGIGTASDAALAMELGCDGVLLASAVARAHDPVRMATAMRHAVEGGRHAFRAGRIPRKHHAEASSPQKGIIGT
jgi:thiazole synthase